MIAEAAIRTLLDPSWTLLVIYGLSALAVALMVIAYTAWSTRND
ncbi:hypothetical protein OG689_10505 [Kitasatospora sp. NBC_00240]|nr:hypothetical protein [Kitasatospora sp. NBC_00240]MCX5209713.1 hypothetical protein [Kitasatospora sp. NBC_00240]